jgi:Protein of unknown function (DUF2845)
MRYLPLLAALWLTQIPPAQAQILRCGSALIQVGMKADEVLTKCGAPSDKTTITEPVYARNPNGATFQTGVATKELWRYDRGSGQFPAVLTIVDGAVDSIEFEH